MAQRGRPRKKQVSQEDNLNNQTVFDKTVFAKGYLQTLQAIYNNRLFSSVYYNPIYGNQIMKDINNSPARPNSKDLKSWVEQPHLHEKELRDTSQFISNVIMQYERSVMHFASILEFNYELIPLQPPPKEKMAKQTYQNSKLKCLDWLKKFRPKKQFHEVMQGVMREGGKFYYLRETSDYYDLQEMPQDYCYINGRTSIGYTYGFNMMYFSRYAGMIDGFAPEFKLWYETFIDEYENRPNFTSIYKAMPPEKSVIFKFDINNAAIKPPLMGVFKDALEIEDYKDLLKLKTELDTYALIIQKIPYDSDGKPLVDPDLAATYIALTQGNLPAGVMTTATALEPELYKFSDTQTMNNINGVGETNYFSSVGIAGNQFGTGQQTGVGLKYSNIADVAYVSHMYDQFENFVNFQLATICIGGYYFAVKFFGDKYSIDDERTSSLSLAQNGGHVGRLYASYGYEPFEYKNIILDEEDDDIKSHMKPLSSSFTQSGKASTDKGGRPTSKDTDLSDSGDKTRDGEYNIDKVTG